MNFNHLCINCMHEKKEGQSICPYCGFDDRTYSAPPYALLPFTPLNGKYIIGKMLGAGGFGITYIALDATLDRVVAVKEFFVQQSMYRQTTMSSEVTVSATSRQQEKIYEVNRMKFEQEARTLAKLTNTQGIVRVYDFFRENHTSYMVLEYLSGMTLKDYVKSKGGRISFDEVIQKLAPVMTSLDILHKTAVDTEENDTGVSQNRNNGIIHRDISPDNIMVSETGQLTLFDFGGAKIQHEVKSYVILAKAGYSPIEQIQSSDETGPWTDVYAMAATIYYCLCGHVPVDSTCRLTGKDPLIKPSQDGAEIMPHQEQILLKGMAVQRKDRYQSMEEFRDALIEVKGKKTLGKAKQFSVALPVAIVLLAAGGIFAAFSWYQSNDEKERGGKEPEILAVKEVEQSEEKNEERDTEKITEEQTHLNAADQKENEVAQEKRDETQQQSEPEETERKSFAQEEGIHQYDFYYTDGSWEDARQSCVEKGGYLVRINNQEELDYIIQGLDAFGLRDTRFYIGARRDQSDAMYYWVDEENDFCGDSITGKSWWRQGEPSLYNADTDGQIAEHVVELYFDKQANRWALNDIPVNLPDYLDNTEGTIGFICEIDE